MDEVTDKEAVEAVGAAALAPGSSSPFTTSSPMGTPNLVASIPIVIGFATSIDTAGELGVLTALEDAVILAEDVIARRQRLILWLGRRYLYCYIYYAITQVLPSRRDHWHADCPRLGSIPANPSYNDALDFQIQMDKLHEGKC